MKEITINVLGDSITWGYEPFTGKQQHSYVEYLKELLKTEQIRNYGINGSTLANACNAYEPMCKRFQKMEKDADIIILLGGTNDFGRSDSNVTLGTIETEDTTSIYGALNKIAKGLKGQYPSSDILFITPLKVAYKDKGSTLEDAKMFRNTRGYTLADVAKAIKDVAKKNQIIVFDLQQECNLDTNESCNRYLPDGIHPTEEYHKKMAEKIAKFIQEKFIR